MLESLIDNIHGARRQIYCTLGQFYNGLSAKDQALLASALDDPDIQSMELARALSEHAKFTGQTVARHRRRGESNGCGCPR